AERTLPPRVRARRLQSGRARPCGIRWPDGRVGGGRWRELQSSIRKPGAGRQLRALHLSTGGPSTVHGRRLAAEGEGGVSRAAHLLHVFLDRILGTRRVADAYQRDWHL